MNSYEIELAVTNFLRTGYAGTVDESSPDTFDSKAEDVTDWVVGFCETIEEPPTRRDAKRFVKVRVIAHCWSKTTDQIKPEKRTAETIAELFRHAVIDVVDYDQSGSPVVGVITLFEPKITDERDTGEGIDEGYSLAMVRVDGVATEA